MLIAVPAYGQSPPQAEFTVSGGEPAVADGVDVERIDSNAPHIILTWSISEEDERDPAAFSYRLERAASPDFSDSRMLYEGRDRASFRAGLAEGSYFYRVRATDEAGNAGVWSRPLHLEVAYQSMRLALSLFAVGAVVFLATLVLIIAGARKDRCEAVEQEEAT